MNLSQNLSKSSYKAFKHLLIKKLKCSLKVVKILKGSYEILTKVLEKLLKLLKLKL